MAATRSTGNAALDERVGDRMRKSESVVNRFIGLSARQFEC